MAKTLTQEDLIKKRDALKVKFDKMSDVISEYEMGADSFSEAEPSEELALMKALARQAYDERRSLQPSNIAAQFAMTLDPSFAPIYKDATTQHVNAARQYFGDMGSIARQSQSEKVAFAKSQKRSDAKLRQMASTISAYDKAILGMSADALGHASAERRTWAAINAQKNKTGKPTLINTEQAIHKLEQENTKIFKNLALSKEQRTMLDWDIRQLSDFKTNDMASAAFKRQLLRHKAKVLAYEMASKQAGSILVTPELIQEMQNQIEGALPPTPPPSGGVGFNTDEAGTVILPDDPTKRFLGRLKLLGQ